MSFEILEIKETDDGDLYFNLPDEMLKSLGWKEGDDLEIDVREDHSIMLTKIKKEEQ